MGVLPSQPVAVLGKAEDVGTQRGGIIVITRNSQPEQNWHFLFIHEPDKVLRRDEHTDTTNKA